MKHFFLLGFIALWPAVASAQAYYIDPDTTQQPGDIYIRWTDLYYAPFAPPGPMDTRANLCAVSDFLRDPNGVGDYWRNYFPIVYDTGAHKFDTLSGWSPSGPGRAIGQNTPWQRFFTAKRDASGNPHDIIAGGGMYDTVTISANEDVDFRASGTVKLENGFRADSGCFFHAYQEPEWDTLVFNDEFNDTAVFNNHWRIGMGWGDINAGAECSQDSNAYIDTDYQAEDGYALDLIMREATNDTCSCDTMSYGVFKTDTCGYNVQSHNPTHFAFSSAMPMSCPWPFNTLSGVIGNSAYAHAPYGKYEFRDKIPHTLHHTNNWGATWDNEFDLNETDNATMGRVNPNFDHHQRYGPFMGIFTIAGGDTGFICPTAGWQHHNPPAAIIIDNFLYRVQKTSSTSDTVQTMVNQWPGYFPHSIVNTTDSTQFYYEEWDPHNADTVTWTVIKGSDGKWDMFSAPYDTSGGIPKLFTKSYQPVSLTLTAKYDSITRAHFDTTFACHWVDTANEPNHGKIYMDQPMDSSDLHTFTEAYQYQTADIYVGKYRYPVPTVVIDRDTATYNYPPVGVDTAAYAHTAYRYHTFTMEWLPHEVRYLIDSNVVFRFPDRLVPPGNPYSDWASTQSRSPCELYPAQFDFDYYGSDPFGTNDSISGGNDVSITYLERHYFETHENSTGEGFWPVTIGGVTYPAAHHLIDYVKIWDVPKDVIIPGYPH